MLIQFPLICWLVPQWIRRNGSNNVRTLSIVYAVHVTTTMVPIMPELVRGMAWRGTLSRTCPATRPHCVPALL